MKRAHSSDSQGAPLMPICQNTTDESKEWNSHVYSREFQSMLEGLDDEACAEESGHVSEKKRRLRVDQVKALEKNFEVENKLEPERKVKLAQELGLQPRQVAVWFQNRRARWKTKNLERDYNVLKANFDSLKRNYESLQHDNEALSKEICELKSKLHGENNENKVAVKEEAVESESDDKVIEQSKQTNSSLGNCEDDDKDLNYDKFDGENCIMNPSIFADFKDGSSDSDSSAILNEQNSPNAAAAISSSSGAFLISNNGGAYSSSSNSKLNCFQFLNSNSKSILGDAPKAYYQPQFVKMEEHNFFSGEECCSSLFTDEQAPTLQWWNWKDS